MSQVSGFRLYNHNFIEVNLNLNRAYNYLSSVAATGQHYMYFLRIDQLKD